MHFYALIAVLILLQHFNPSLSLGLDDKVSSGEALGHGDASGAVVRCIEREREALLAFKQGLVDEYNQLTSWGSPDCCTWEGVFCSNQTKGDHVIKLDLLPYDLQDFLTYLDNMVMLDLSYNAISGKIPATIGSLFRMETLKLRSNGFVGELPSSLKNCTGLRVIDLGNNTLSGPIPKWLGVSFQGLVILMLSSNQFNGSMPSQLCRLSRIQILDFSMNNISGGIPKCFNNLTTLAQKGNPNMKITHYYEAPEISDEYEDDAAFICKGSMQVYRNTLGLMKRIDFSSNRLIGEIPKEISHLVGLVSLNLSRNRLTGHITPDIGKLQSLDALDLSRNQLDGRIPTSLARIDRLGVLDLSYNNLFGEIPIGTQLQSFDPSTYAGNPQLCGPPLQKPCIPEKTDRPYENIGMRKEEEKDELISRGFYICAGLGFFAGFWGVCGSLIFIRSWRYAYINFLNVLDDWFFVRIALIRRRWMLKPSQTISAR